MERAGAFEYRKLFDPTRFAQALQEQSVLATFRTAIKQGDALLKQWFYEGVPVAELVPARAWLIDRLLQQCWSRFFSQEDAHLALVAVGGYGRGELHPCSDVDIMILLENNDVDPYRESLESLLAFLWDIGLEVAQSVRSLADCVREASADVSVITSLMEARLLAGNLPLFERMRRLTGPQVLWTDDEFFHAKKQEQTQRHQKFHGSAYNLEPNVKEAPGGLRDLQMIGWVAKRHFGVDTLGDLVERGFLTEQEYQELLDCQQFLWRVRFTLHTLAGRREDVVLFDYQKQLAAQFGYQDNTGNLAVEQFMQSYYRTVMALGRLNEILLQLFEEAIVLADDPGEPVAINDRFQSRKGYLEVTGDDIFIRYPCALLEVFLLLQKHAELKGIRAATIRLIRVHQGLIDDRFRHDVRAQALFMKILRQSRGVTLQMRRMNYYGVLGSYLPEFALIVGRMQYDLFHAYTVDQHILFVVRNLRHFYLPQHAHELPHVSGVMRRLPRPALLYLAALYHDIAKGRGGDHSELGALDARRFCRRHGLSQVDTGLVVWLVRQHLSMSLTAQKRDIDDPVVIQEFAQMVGDQRHLDYLYVLTVADIRGTNPKLWSSWRASLLLKLYDSTRRALRRDLGNPIDKQELITEIQSQARARLLAQKMESDAIEKLWAGFGDDYFLRHMADEVVWHTRAILKREDDSRALVLARADPARGGALIFIYARDEEWLFARMVATMDRLGLNVLDARIITGNSGYTLDSYTVTEDSGEFIHNRGRIKEIVNALRRSLDRHEAVTTPMRRTPRLLRHFKTSTQMTFTPDEANQRTVMELITSDRPGLLSRVGQGFRECGIQLQNAKIATIGARAEDVFFITAVERQPLSENQQNTLRTALLAQLEEEPA
ncbi:MAG: [protein-PII] uridylyltransferase [Gammaproteobacteria bacterium]|nr:[protein-PII] uridylyltransferase [Gammaproteobacteria bacterium]MCP5458823.1 [protein-PII] uridylyltransferase [Gammaproteobacteria bacterium]